jgi:DNA polymerase III psi subunit
MLSNRQQAYLDAMDIGVWNLRESVPPVPEVALNLAQLKLGPGSGRILLICAADTDSASRLANDINRALGGAPVWAWPVDAADAVDLGNAVTENLFTTVAFFGQSVASRFFAGEPPAHLNSANLVLLPSMQDIQGKAEARRALWASFCRSGMIDHDLKGR